MSTEPTLTVDERWKIGADKAKAIEATRPPWAQAVIVAELEADRCDSQSDYYNSETVRRVVLAWSKHKRDVFSELRKAAATFPDTAHLGPDCDVYRARVILSADVMTNGSAYHKGQSSPWHSDLFEESEQYGRGKRFTRRAEAEAFISTAPAPYSIEVQTAAGSVTVPFEWQITHESIEHREKYSLGHGYYLSAGGQYSGWQVRKTWTVDGHYHLENRIGTAAPAAEDPAPAPASVSGVTVSLNAERGGVELRFPSKPDDAIRDRLKAHGWRWSRFSSCWYHRDSPDTRAFAAELAGLERVSDPGPKPEASAAVNVFNIGGREYTRNKRGRCEDAPCCGCCTI